MPDGPTEFRSRLSGRAARPALNPGESALRLVWHPWHASCEALIRRRAIAVSPNRRVVRDVQDSRVQPAHLTRLTVRRLSVVAERVAWTFGSVCLLTYGVMHVDGAVGARQELARVAQVQSATVASPRPPDMSLWGSERIIAWRRASLEPAPPPLAVLRIPKIPPRGSGPARHRRLHSKPRGRPHRRHGTAGRGRQLRNRRASRRLFQRLERCRPG